MLRAESCQFRNSIIYEVFPRNHTQQGTLEAVIPDLDRIKQLGVDILWLMPIHPIGTADRKGVHGSPYAISDYESVHKDLGGESAFRKLIDATHARGMKLMIDVVFNHMAVDTLLAKSHPEFFLRDSQGLPTRKVADWTDIVDFDYSNRGLWNYLLGVLEKWSDFGVDGFRCDVAPLIPLEFWKEARRRINSKRSTIWLAESTHKSFIKELRAAGQIAHSDPELHQVFDLTYDYDGYEELEHYWRGEGLLADWIRYLSIQSSLYPANSCKMRFLENHDKPRAASLIRCPEMLRNWTLLHMLLPGTFLIYAGQEFGSAHLPQLFEKDIISLEDFDKEFSTFFREALALSKRIKASCHNFKVKLLGTGIIKVEWTNDAERHLFLLNLEGKTGAIKDTDFPGHLTLESAPWHASMHHGHPSQIERFPC